MVAQNDKLNLGESVAVAQLPLTSGYATLPTSSEEAPDGRERLAPYKVPRHVVFRDSLPKTSIGKVLRRELMKEG